MRVAPGDRSGDLVAFGLDMLGQDGDLLDDFVRSLEGRVGEQVELLTVMLRPDSPHRGRAAWTARWLMNNWRGRYDRLIDVFAAMAREPRTRPFAVDTLAEFWAVAAPAADV